MISWSLLTTLVLAGFTTANPMRRAECSALHLVFAAGTGEVGLGLAGTPFSDALATAIPGTTTYAISYDTSVEYNATLVTASESVQKHFVEQVAACPDQKFVFGGYSKGAMVLHRTSLPSAIKSKQIALVVFGDPYLKYQTTEHENAWPIDNPIVNLSPVNKTVSGANIASFCNVGDVICDLTGGEVGPHLAYGADGSASKAAQLNRSLAPQLHRVLQNLGNLKSLSLAITPNALNVLLSDLVAPFHLDTFAHSGKLSTPLLRFLEQQSSITKLGWQVAMSQREVDSLYFSVEGNPRLLPELEVLEGPLNLLKALIQIRRISRVTIFQWLGYYSYIEEFLASIKLAMVPITQLGFVDDVPIGTGWIGIGWIGIAKRLQSTPAFSTLKELRVVKLFRKGVDDYGPKIGDVFPSNPPFDFLHFEALEKFEFTHSTGVRHAPPPVGVDEWLIFHQMHQLTAWRELSPSLHTVLLWGSVVS
ncbi:unnamed protein product [Rhizoctonia solani]|nr:unnamed protein product [Rhizoctonia solani]